MGINQKNFADMSTKEGGGGQNHCPPIKCKFLRKKKIKRLECSECSEKKENKFFGIFVRFTLVNNSCYFYKN